MDTNTQTTFAVVQLCTIGETAQVVCPTLPLPSGRGGGETRLQQGSPCLCRVTRGSPWLFALSWPGTPSHSGVSGLETRRHTMPSITSHDLKLLDLLKTWQGPPATRHDRYGLWWTCLWCGSRLSLTVNCWTDRFHCETCHRHGDLLAYVCQRRNCNRYQAAAALCVPYFAEKEPTEPVEKPCKP